MPPARESLEKQLETVLSAAAQAIEESSLLDFRMAAIGKIAGLSMGSIYKHIQSKEDVLVALATRATQHEARVFEEILSLPLSVPERMTAFLLKTPQKTHLYPFGVHLEIMMSIDDVLERASMTWRERLGRASGHIYTLFLDLIDTAIRSGELKIDPQDEEQVRDQLLCGPWALCVGQSQVVYHQHAIAPPEHAQPLPYPIPVGDPIVQFMKRLLNTYAWRTPLNDEGLQRICQLMEERGYR